MTDLEYINKYYKGNKKDAIEKLNQGIPVQYIVGNVDFYGNVIEVNSNVLIPRFETELLVEKTINYIKKYFNNNISILDIGTGSGCIAISLKKEFPNFLVSASDISEAALKVAQRNAKINQVDINFYHSNLFNNISGKYDVIISNPPYISYDEEIMDIVKNNEPHLALYAPLDGIYFYDKILENINRYLNDKFMIAFEIGHNQADKLSSLAKKYFPMANIIVDKDLSIKERYIFIINIS